jgi:hypothetical protein
MANIRKQAKGVVRQIQQTNKKIEKIEIFPSAMKNKMN